MSYYHTTITTPIGDLVAIANDTHLMMLEFADSEKVERKISSCEKEVQSPILEKTEKELSEYFAGTRQNFDIPLAPSGTDFQQKAWNTLEKIPYGETRNYKEEALLAGTPNAIRAIGGANNKNPILIIIPCHRIIGKSGNLIGYRGGLQRKAWLLKHEEAYTHLL